MDHVGYVVEVKKLRPHTNADRLVIATFFDNDTCVSNDIQIGDIGIYFPSDLQLSEEFCDQNHLCRKTATGEPDTGYLERNKRRITAIKLRGEKSDGIYMPLKSLEYTDIDLSTLKIGDPIGTINGHEICCKYIPIHKNRRDNGTGNRTRKKRLNIAPLFAEHADTEQLAYNLNAFQVGDEVEITLKMHGTSGRTARLPVRQGYKRTFLDRLFKRDGKPIYDWGYVSGTRRTVLDGYDGGYYGSNKFRKSHSEIFEGKLPKGVSVYYEIVGFTTDGTPIMGTGKNKSLGKDFVKQYGETTVFSYGCVPNPHNETQYNDSSYGYQNEPVEITYPQSDIYVYRMTYTNEDGDVFEIPPDEMRFMCGCWNIKTVPVFDKFIITQKELDRTGLTAGEYVKQRAEKYYEGPDPIGKSHVREGVVVRIINKHKFTAFKYKGFAFKCITGITITQLEDSGATDNIDADILSEM